MADALELTVSQESAAKSRDRQYWHDERIVEVEDPGATTWQEPEV